MTEERFVAKLQSMHRVSIPPKSVKKLNIKNGDLIDVIIKKMEWKE